VSNSNLAKYYLRVLEQRSPSADDETIILTSQIPVDKINGELGWLSALGTRGVHRPLSDPSTDLQVRCHGSERDGRDVPQPDVAC
jgi:hypothetical protein